MAFLLKLKHWQLFLILVALPMTVFYTLFGLTWNIQINATDQSITSQELGEIFGSFMIVMSIFLILVLSWYYTLGTRLHRKLPGTVRMNLNLFRLFLFIPFAYMIGLLVFLYDLISNINLIGSFELSILLLIIPLHLFSIFCIFYCIYFIAKALKTVEMQAPVKPDDFIGEFFLVWVFPAGIWFVQPRINRIFDNTQEAEGQGL